ncbi:hypothetical protein PC114_g14794 [Phytophthora cactorum]|nr:hypothetical protein PC114_g14794 [Phytophthora cactorum]
MEALALDEEALKKLRVDGWNFHSSTHPTRTEAYPGLYSGAKQKRIPPALITKDTTRLADVARGSATVAVAKSCPQLQVLRWWDRLPVYLLLTGSSTTVDTCARHVPGGRRINIPCPSSVISSYSIFVKPLPLVGLVLCWEQCSHKLL